MARGVSIQGLPEAQAAMRQAIVAVKPSGALGKAVKAATLHLHRYAVDITHVWTGALRASHHIAYGGGATAEIYIDPGAIRGDGARPSAYGPAEHDKGGSHAFYARTVAEDGGAAVAEADNELRSALP